MGKTRFLPAVVLFFLTLPGVYGLVWRFRTGLVDTNLNNYVVWGLWVAMYIYFLGLSAGGFVLSSLVYGFGLRQFERVGKLAVLQAFVCMLVGVAFIWIDLGHPLRFLYVFGMPNPTSLLSWEAFIYLAYLLILLLELGLLAGTHSPDELPKGQRWLLRFLALAGIFAAVGVHWGTGALFAVVKARPEWNTGITPVAFLLSAAASGAGLLMVFTYLFGTRDSAYAPAMSFLAALTVGVLIADVVLLVSEALVVWYGGVEHEVSAYRHLYFGPYWYVTWLLHAGVGIVLPLAIFASPLRKNTHALALFGLCVVLGTVGYRLNIVIPAQIDAPFREMVFTYYHPRNINTYFPSAMEWLSALGVVTLGIWLFWGAWKIVGRPERQLATAAERTA